MAERGASHSRRDRWAEWLVVLVVLLALAMGWVVMAAAEGQHKAYTDTASGLTIRYPHNWLLKPEKNLVFQAVDPASAGFRTAYQIRAWAIDATAPLTSSMVAVLNDASLLRAQTGTAYRLLDLAEGRGVGGFPTAQAAYVFVVEGRDLFLEQLPVVVRGLDVAVPRGDQVYVFSLLAAESVYKRALPGFMRFVDSAEWK